MGRPNPAALAFALALASPLASAQPAPRWCANPRRPVASCFGYLFVGDGERRTRVVVDGRAAGSTPVIVHLDPQRPHTVRVGSLRRRILLRAREIVELEVDPGTAAARDRGDDAALAALRNRAVPGFASVLRPDTCGGPWIVPLRPALPLNAWRAHDLWTDLPAAQARRVVPRPEELVTRQSAACERGDAGACEDAAQAHRDLADAVPGMSPTRSEALLAFACDTLRSARACDTLGRQRGGIEGEAEGLALLQRACDMGLSESCRTLAIGHEIRALQNPTTRDADIETARRLYRRGCDLGNAACCLPARRLDSVAEGP